MWINRPCQGKWCSCLPNSFLRVTGLLFVRWKFRKAETNNKQECRHFFLSNKDFRGLCSFLFVLAWDFLRDIHQITSLAIWTCRLSREARFFDLWEVKVQSPRSFWRCYLGLFKGTSTLKSTIKNLNIGLTQDMEMCKHVYEWEDFLKC